MCAEIEDIRRIRFPKRILPRALAAVPGTLGRHVAPAEIEDIEIESMNPPALRVCFRATTSAPREYCSVGAEALAAALIGYCRRLRVPIPRGARKSIAIENDAVVLVTDHRCQPDDGQVWPRMTG